MNRAGAYSQSPGIYKCNFWIDFSFVNLGRFGHLLSADPDELVTSRPGNTRSRSFTLGLQEYIINKINKYTYMYIYI